MGENSKGINWSVLWKSDDWMSVWIGFFILIFFLAGATMSLPGWKWIGDGSFQDKIAGYAKKVDSVVKDAEAKGEPALKDQAAALKTAWTPRTGRPSARPPPRWKRPPRRSKIRTSRRSPPR